MIGIDIVEIERVRAAAEKPAFMRGVFTEAERAYYAEHGSKAETLAGMFCAKEAVAKALGSGFCGFRPCDVEIGHTAAGAPTVALLGAAAEKYPAVCVEVSISHCKEYATAAAMIVKPAE